jgi:penicillin-binding protein 1A
MAEELKDKPSTPFRVPPGIRLVRVNAATGRPAQPGESNVIYEAFKPDTVPTGGEEQVLDINAGVMGLGYGAISGIGAAEDQPAAGAPMPEESPGSSAAPSLPVPNPSPEISPVPSATLVPSPGPNSPEEPAVPQAGGLY